MSNWLRSAVLVLVALSACVHERVEVGDLDLGLPIVDGSERERERERDDDSGRPFPPFPSLDGDLPADAGGCEVTPVSLCWND